LSIYFGEENDVTACATIFNRYGSRIIEALLVTKESESYLLTGSQPYADYPEPFLVKAISNSIGCSAPNTMCVIDTGYEVAQGDFRNGVIWLDTTGPVMFAGETIKHLRGIENYFNPVESECLKYSIINKATAYIDWINKEYNLLFPSGSAATTNNVWLVYDLVRRRWYEKVPDSYPVVTATVKDTDGVKYNYGMLASGHMMHLDDGQTWNGSVIAQQITTGEFMVPAPEDQTGFWTFNELSAIKVLSADVDEDVNLTISTTYDGSSHSPDLTVDLNATGDFNYTRNTTDVNRVGAQGYTFQIDFSADTNTTKWSPLMWGFKSKAIRED
jgi:hypothetical protein